MPLNRGDAKIFIEFKPNEKDFSASLDYKPKNQNY